MTNKEAIRIISGEVLGTTEQTHEAVAMAVKALSAQSQQVTSKLNSDCISRQDAIDALYRMLHDCFWADDEELDAVITTLNELPSAQRKGKWIYLTGLDSFECSVCGSAMVRNIFNYCPWCGARMVKGEDNEL